jgi:hypothetical protein
VELAADESRSSISRIVARWIDPTMAFGTGLWFQCNGFHLPLTANPLGGIRF